MRAASARDPATLLAENAAAMSGVRTSHICQTAATSFAAALNPTTDTSPPPAAAAPSHAVLTQPLREENAALREENARLRAELDEAHQRAGKIAELQRRKGEIHSTLLRAAHEEALRSRDEARADAAAAHGELARASEEMAALRARMQRQQQTAQAEAGLLAAEAEAARNELVGVRDGARTTSAAGVHVAVLRGELRH
jgi:hypothetical protein